jgi:mono/diheme cytochrome c family protein
VKLHRLLIAILVIAVVLEGALIGFLFMRASWQGQVEGTPVVRGQAVAERLGCFGCHGPGGESPIPNPGSVEGLVPAWNGDSWGLFNEDASDVREWILNGHPTDREPDSAALIPMPAYEGMLTDTELDDLVAYFLSVAQFGWPGDLAVAQGRGVATKYGCFGCHGPEGRGLVENPLSFKGYIPPWDGDDYLELVQNDDEFRQWVKNGVSDRFRDNPAARAFVDRQLVPMPAYSDLISDEEIDQLLAFVEWMRANPRAPSAQ